MASVQCDGGEIFILLQMVYQLAIDGASRVGNARSVSMRVSIQIPNQTESRWSTCEAYPDLLLQRRAFARLLSRNLSLLMFSAQLEERLVEGCESSVSDNCGYYPCDVRVTS